MPKYHFNSRVSYRFLAQFFSSCIFCLTPALSFSQVPEQSQSGVHSLQLHAGSVATSDETLQAVVHSGKTLGLKYHWDSPKSRITRLSVKSTYTRLVHPLEFESESFAFENQIGFNKLLPVSLVEGLHLGGAAVLWNEISYYPYWDEQHIYWVTSGHIAASLRYELPGDRRTHAFTLQTPILSVVSRPAENRLTVADEISFYSFTNSIFSDLEVGFLNNHLGITAGYEYLFNWSGKKLGITAELNYHRITTDNSKLFQRQQLLIGTRYVF